MDIEELSISQVHENYRNGTWTCENLTQAFLDRIQRLDKSGPRINSTLAISTVAVKEAIALDEYFSKHEQFQGRLHGIPVLVKDQADTKGMVTTYGSSIAKNNTPDKDAFIVEKLKSEGAIILGKTTMGDWATTWFSTSSATDWEFTHNPYKLGYDVGGSSSGSAAAVAANFCVLAVAEDTGGSIRCPASFTNTVGLRCTPGLVSRTGFCPLVKTQDTPGPIARTVRDCALMLDCLVGFDEDDEWTIAAVTGPKPSGGSYAAQLDPTIVTSARIGLIRSLFGPDSDPYCRLVNSVINKAIEKLTEAGTTFIDVELSRLTHYMENTPTYLVRSRSDINEFLATKPHLPSDIASIMPKDPPHPSLDFTSQVAHGPEDPNTDSTYLQRLLDRDEFQRRLTCLMVSNGLDALAFPDVQVPPPHHEDSVNGRFKTCWDFPTNTLLASQARVPAISVPVGFTDDGLPVGLELVSWEYREQALLQLASGVEYYVPSRKAPVLE